MQHFSRRTTYVPFRRFGGELQRDFMQRLSASLHGGLGLYLHDASYEGSDDAVACLLVPRALVFFLFSSFCLVISVALSCKELFIMGRKSYDVCRKRYIHA
jgi:hypothetical protein